MNAPIKKFTPPTKLIEILNDFGYTPRTLTTEWVHRHCLGIREVKILNQQCIDIYLAEVQSWLMREYKYFVRVDAEFYKDGINYLWQVMVYDPEGHHCVNSELSTGSYGDNGDYSENHQALEAGLIRAMEILKSVN